jgi:hypothetical protein
MRERSGRDIEPDADGATPRKLSGKRTVSPDDLERGAERPPKGISLSVKL